MDSGLDLLLKASKRQAGLAKQRDQALLDVRPAIERLLSASNGCSGQTATIRQFLLAWWNADEFGGFNFTALWSLDDSLVDDVVAVFNFVAYHRIYPDAATVGFKEQFEALALLKAQEPLVI